jgi:CBS domain-containing protein
MGRNRWRHPGLVAPGLMSRPAVTIGPLDLVSHAAHLMYDHRITCLPVVDRERLVGVISRADVLTVFGRTDADIRWDIVGKLLLQEFLTDPGRFTVTVRDGVVTLAGRPETAEMGRDIVTAVRHMEGVVAVLDELSHPPADGRRAQQRHAS